MATKTSNGTGGGNWGTAATWAGGVAPVDDDTVVIASGDTVIFNVDTSSWTAGINGLTITGTLKVSTTTSSYMKMKAATVIVGAGTFNIGEAGAGAIPFAVKFTLTGGAGWYIDGNAGLTMTVYGAEPSIKYIKLSGSEAIGQTELSVDTDVTGDIWADGDIVRIDDINMGQESEERVIAAGGIAAGAITVTAGLTAAKSTGAIVSLITRNIKIIAVGTGTRTIYRVGATANKLTVQSGMWYGVNKYMFEACHYATISGGTFSGNAQGLYNCTSATISGGTFSGNSYGLRDCTSATISGGTFSGNTQGLYNCTSATISGGTFSGNSYGLYNCPYATISGGTFSGNGQGVGICTNATISGGTFSGNTQGLRDCTSATISGGTFTTNTNDLYNTFGMLHNITLTAATEHSTYTSLPSQINCQSEDHDGVDGALKAWCKGGVVTSQVTVKPDGYTQAYLLDPESATYPVFFTKQFSVEPSKTVNVVVQLRKDASMTYLPRVYLMASIGNPLAGATPVDTFTMTDSTDTWESDTFTIANSTDYDQDYTLYFVAQNATDNAYAAYDITTQGGGGGGGAVSIQPYSGRISL
jgi:hypothetical protein